ncbi:MAG: hypothetical protein RL150_173 [Candidatus Parcubacteria bacterium]|jgi:cytoskeletal protein RodZ
MTEEERQLLQETARLAKENHKLLKSLHRKQTMTAVWSTIKWGIIIVITLWTWIALQPTLERMQDLYTQVQATSETVNGLKVGAENAIDTAGFSDLLNLLGTGQ